jgi:hypothetical protein
MGEEGGLIDAYQEHCQHISAPRLLSMMTTAFLSQDKAFFLSIDNVLPAQCLWHKV